MQYLSTASARVFLSSKLSSHNTYRCNKSTKKCEKSGERKVKKRKCKGLYHKSEPGSVRSGRRAAEQRPTNTLALVTMIKAEPMWR